LPAQAQFSLFIIYTYLTSMIASHLLVT